MPNPASRQSVATADVLFHCWNAGSGNRGLSPNTIYFGATESVTRECAVSVPTRRLAS
ncbi:hypothetical protein [Roseimaritima ulvae]|uniref:Uncharacterized protein n=1 Tax=Roseimaritima ulvae TaxID=980254 RepID=A0A5B9QNF5_9BACT|nr:hypothetical protein [Roseimaritima ulvae]QEG40504.1 hypothetical protein UC8_25160 [Roseimaritima ulvae]